MSNSPTTTFLGFNVWLMNTETLFKRNGRSNILTFTINALYQINDISRMIWEISSDVIFLTSNSTNKCTAKDHVFFIDVARVTTSKTTVFFSPRNWKREGINNSLRFLLLLYRTLFVSVGNKDFKLSSLSNRDKCFLIRVN